jgi:hypothetical protein
LILIGVGFAVSNALFPLLQIEISRLYKTHEVVMNNGRIENPKPHCIIMKPIWAMVEQANFCFTFT